MNSVPHAEHQLTGDHGAHRLNALDTVADAVHDLALLLEYIRGNGSDRVDQIKRCRPCDFNRSLDLTIATSMIVVNLRIPESFDQALEMIENMPVVSAD